MNHIIGNHIKITVIMQYIYNFSHFSIKYFCFTCERSEACFLFQLFSEFVDPHHFFRLRVASR